MIKISKFEGEIPEPKRKGNQFKYPLPDMKVGDCFPVPDGKLQSVRSSALNYGKLNDKGFVVREAESGYVCIRIS